MIGTLEIDSDSNWIAPLAVSNGSLRSLRCPLLSRRLRRIRRDDSAGDQLGSRRVGFACRSAARTSRAWIAL
jgi:hypothetical protein